MLMFTIMQNPTSRKTSFWRMPVGLILKGLFFGLTVCFALSIGFLFGKASTVFTVKKALSQLGIKGVSEEKQYPLLKYSFSELSKRGGVASKISIDRELLKTAEFTAYVFHYETDGRKMSGQLNVPSGDANEQRPVIVLLRGYVDSADYTIGKGSSPTAAALASAGYITVAPDFLGFGESDPPPPEALAERFVKPMNVLDLFATVENMDKEKLQFEGKNIATVDGKRLGLWGHSNGGQIAISYLEITGRSIPTVLLAPVSKYFPYSVLFFTGESEDHGKGMRSVIAKFEDTYNIDQFSIGNNLEHVTAKIQLHQGGKDDSVPQSWSDDFYSYFAGKGKKDQIEYFVYPDADHLLIPNTDIVKQRAVAFFDDQVKHPKPTPTPEVTATPELIEATESAEPVASKAATLILEEKEASGEGK